MAKKAKAFPNWWKGFCKSLLLLCYITKSTFPGGERQQQQQQVLVLIYLNLRMIYFSSDW
ncbi:MAG: hypothetical protein ACI8P3_004450 [Saprospiraceae bacterium]|jgi:hypothetical protein